jgi:hypothetical protein
MYEGSRDCLHAAADPRSNGVGDLPSRLNQQSLLWRALGCQRLRRGHLACGFVDVLTENTAGDRLRGRWATQRSLKKVNLGEPGWILRAQAPVRSLRLQARQWPSVHDLHPFDRRHLTQRPWAGGGAVRRQPGEHLVLREHRRPVARTPARIGDNRGDRRARPPGRPTPADR